MWFGPGSSAAMKPYTQNAATNKHNSAKAALMAFNAYCFTGLKSMRLDGLHRYGSARCTDNLILALLRVTIQVFGRL
jgi:hypothetical protein